MFHFSRKKIIYELSQTKENAQFLKLVSILFESNSSKIARAPAIISKDYISINFN